ncbi:MAG: hypothetical protein WCY11_08995 [Novosphingobium sp.]
MPAHIVHIGYHKTATTWLQECVFPSATSHVWTARAVTQQAFLRAPGLHFDAGEARRVLGLDGEPARALLLSEENLSGYLHNAGLHGLLAPEMARRIHATMPGAQIVITIRNQQDICRAAYAQYVSGGGTWGPGRYFDTASKVRGALTRPWKAPAFGFEHFEFDRLIGWYDNLFGREQVHVYPYEWLSDRAALLARMQADLGLELAYDVKADKRANPSLGPVAQTVLRGVNLFTRQSVINKDVLVDLPGGQFLRHGVKAALAAVPGMNRQAATLPASIRARIAAHYPESNRRLLALRDLPLAELGYPL